MKPTNPKLANCNVQIHEKINNSMSVFIMLIFKITSCIFYFYEIIHTLQAGIEEQYGRYIKKS